MYENFSLLCNRLSYHNFYNSHWQKKIIFVENFNNHEALKLLLFKLNDRMRISKLKLKLQFLQRNFNSFHPTGSLKTSFLVPCFTPFSHDTFKMNLSHYKKLLLLSKFMKNEVKLHPSLSSTTDTSFDLYNKIKGEWRKKRKEIKINFHISRKNKLF